MLAHVFQRLAFHRDPINHAIADIQDQSHREGVIVQGKEVNFLLFSVIEEFKAVLGETSDWAVERICNDDRH